MKNITYITLLCWSPLLASTKECPDPVTLNPTGVHSIVKLVHNPPVSASDLRDYPNLLTEPNSYLFYDVRVYTISKSPLVQYALLGDQDLIVALHLKEPYNMNSTYVNTDHDAFINFKDHNDSDTKPASEFLKMYGTNAEEAFKSMRDNCNFVIFEEYQKLLERETLNKSMETGTIIMIVCFVIFVLLSCLLNYWAFKNLWVIRSEIKKIEKAIPFFKLAALKGKFREGPYDYVECIEPRKSEYGYDTVLLKNNNGKRSSTYGYVTPVNSIKKKTYNCINDIPLIPSIDSEQVVYTPLSDDMLLKV